MKLPRDISGGQAVRALQRLGFSVVRQVGSHIRIERAGLHVTVPNHSAIAPGTLASILKQAEVSLDDFLAAL